VSDEEALLRAVVDRPDDGPHAWLVLADWLDENGRSEQADLLRLQYQPGWQPGLTPRQRQARIVRLLASGVRPCVPAWSNSLGMRFVWCPPGTFLMGSPDDEPERDPEEEQHRVTLTRGFWMGAAPVTQSQWQAVTGNNPSGFRGEERPVEMVSWDDCVAFCRQLSEREGREYRLPTEAEWEYACRAGTTSPYFWGDTVRGELVNYNGSYRSDLYRGETTPAGSLPPNVWGVHDAHGNVWEWCADFSGRYTSGAQMDPVGPRAGNAHVLRGGSWFSNQKLCRSAYRSMGASANRFDNLGCRVCLSAV
jgi:uncharacterized protein (TIGR02996 family)